MTNCPADYAVVMLRPDGRIASWNSAAEHIFGYDIDHAIGRSFACLYPREAVDAGIPERDLATARATGATLLHDVRRKDTDGRLFRAGVYLASILDNDGSHLGFVQFVLRHDRDAWSPAQKYAETLAKADLVLRSVHDCISVQDAAGAVLYANDAAARLFGLPNARAMLTTPTEQLATALEVFNEHGTPLDLTELMLASDARRESGKAQLFYMRDRRTREGRWWLARFTTLRDAEGRAELIINVATDVTDTVRSKDAARFLSDTTLVLSASLDYATTLRGLVEALVPRLANWASVMLVEEGALRRVAVAHADPAFSATASEIWAPFPMTRVIPPAFTNVLRTGEVQLHTNVTDETLRSYATTEEHLALLRRIRPRSIIVAPIVVGGRPDGVLVLSSVEPKRQYDRGDLELVTEIGRRAGTAIEHARLYSEAQRAVRLRDEFLSIAAHELRTPLAALTLQLQSLKLTSSGGEDRGERFDTRIGKTLRHSNRLARLVDGLLDVSRIAGGQLVLRREDVDLCTIATCVCERLAEDAERAGSDLSFSSSGPCVGSWDSERLDQVVSNLVSNAIKYGRGKPVEVRCSTEGDNAVITVTDRGIGIAPEDLSRVFGRFERAVSERNYAGLGLGLWIAKEIAEAHGGRVEVTSAVGEGAVFRLVVPLRSVSSATEVRPI